MGQGRGSALSTIRPRVIKGSDKMGLPWDAYYVLAKANAALTNSKVHPNTGAPDYDITHNLSDLVIDTDLNLGVYGVIGPLDVTGDIIASTTISADLYKWTGAAGGSLIELQSIVNTWLFKTKDGLGADDSGLYFDIDNSRFELRFINFPMWSLSVLGTGCTYGYLGDYAMAFSPAGTFSGLFTWMEDEDYFKFSDDIFMDITEKIYFRNAATSINSANVGHLDLNAATSIDLNAASNIGDGGTTNYAGFAADGELTLHGTARVKRHINLTAQDWKRGVGSPDIGTHGTFPTLNFDAISDDMVYYSLLCPYKFEAGTTIKFTVDWTYSGAQDDGTVCWGLEYINVTTGETVDGATTTITKTSAGEHTTGKLVRTTFTTEMSGMVAQDTIGMRLYRDVSADTLVADAVLINTHFEFTMDKLGKPT